MATERFLFAGEMDLTDLETGRVDANRITKGACGRDAGFVPANGLIYTFPKHCVCWPMLRDYAALAPARPGGDPLAGASRCPSTSPLENGAGRAADGCRRPQTRSADWPCYRHDAWRSGSTPGRCRPT